MATVTEKNSGLLTTLKLIYSIVGYNRDILCIRSSEFIYQWYMTYSCALMFCNLFLCVVLCSSQGKTKWDGYKRMKNCLARKTKETSPENLNFFCVGVHRQYSPFCPRTSRLTLQIWEILGNHKEIQLENIGSLNFPIELQKVQCWQENRIRTVSLLIQSQTQPPNSSS